MSWTRRHLLFLALLLACGPAAVLAPQARAEFGQIQLVSKSASEQADEALTPALSGDGSFVVFAGRLGGISGLFRKELRGGAIRLVAELPGPEELTNADPSISADGRYVAFDTAVPLDPEDDLQPHSTDVYVADLSTTPPTYELASALDGCEPETAEDTTACGLTYAGPEGERGGAVAAAGVALSADGRSVAFLTRAQSDLTTGDPASIETSAGQVAVRRLDTDETILITEPRGASGPVPGGGAATASEPGANSEGAAISADGTTVAWVGRDLPDQVPMLPDEAARVRALETGPGTEPLTREYHEPLWRRVPSPLDLDPPTRRVVGGGDPLAPGCPSDGTLAIPACQGPFPESSAERKTTGPQSLGRGWGLSVPRLDHDGEIVAFIGDPEEVDDLFVVNMAPGLSRRQAVRQLTHWVNPRPGGFNVNEPFEGQFSNLSGPINSCALSPNGKRIAFFTIRQVFPTAPPTLITPPPPGLSVDPEIYQLDLEAETIERLRPNGGAPAWASGPGGNSPPPTYSEDGQLLAFESVTPNLVAGDTNEAADVFVVESPLAPPIEETSISPHPSQISVQPLWRMTAGASSLRDGRVRVVLGLPGAGTVRVGAEARLGRRLKRRRVAAGHLPSQGAGPQRMTLSLPRKLRGLARRKRGLSAELDVDFAGPGGKPLRAALQVRFLVHGARPKKGRKR